MSIYFYLLPESNLVKIGCSYQVEQRILTLATGCIEDGRLIRVIDSFGFKAEKWLHHYFEPLRVKGEWFKFREDMLTIQPPNEYGDLNNEPTINCYQEIAFNPTVLKAYKSFWIYFINLTKPERWLFSKIASNTNYNSNVKKVIATTITETHNIKQGYKKLYEDGLICRIKRGHYMINPTIIKTELRYIKDIILLWNTNCHPHKTITLGEVNETLFTKARKLI